ncbi:MAG: hypothetical protein OJF49_002895 [Ktedonobacterales bacterium]|nr:MAG: hypothetical protein OJF49_002895 [Ktedonobacterales bacterium]
MTTVMDAKMALVKARDLGQPDALGTVLGTYPASYTPDLIEFDAGLVATSGYANETPTPETESIAARALSRAFAHIFVEPAIATGPLAAAQGALATLRGLRRARGLTPRVLGQKIGLGVDIISSLEAGMIRVVSIPDRLIRALSDALGTTVEQMQNALATQPMVEPALRRDQTRGGQHTSEQSAMDFADAVRVSPNMTDAEKSTWLGE